MHWKAALGTPVRNNLSRFSEWNDWQSQAIWLYGTISAAPILRSYSRTPTPLQAPDRAEVQLCAFQESGYVPCFIFVLISTASSLSVFWHPFFSVHFSIDVGSCQ